MNERKITKRFRDHVDEDDKTVNEAFTVNGTMGILINESGMYSFGDFSYYNIGDRGARSFAELKELYAGNGMVDKNGNHDIKVGFSEPRSDGSSNAKIANILEYGTSSQSAKPFLKPAKSAVKKQCVEAMKSAFEKEVEGL